MDDAQAEEFEAGAEDATNAMTKKSHLFMILFTIITVAELVIPVSASGGAKPGDGKLNLLLITIDTLRPDRLGCYQSPHLKTPTIDALAERGVLFSRAFAHNPETLPSHANILLGVTPLVHGVHDNVNFIVRPEFLTMATWLKDRGYATAAIIAAFPLDSRFGLTRGFDLYDDGYGVQGPEQDAFTERKAAVVVGKAKDWLKAQEGPWFLWVHCFDPHQPYDPPEPYATRYKSNPYNGEVAYVDDALRGLFDFLVEKHWNQKTAVILTADHGESLGDHGELTHGYFAYNSTLWVPLIIAAPGLKPGRVGQNVCHVDIFPTACDLLRLDKPAILQGVSLVPTMGGKSLPRRSIYIESLMAYCSRGWAPLTGFIREQTKFLESPIPELYDIEKDFDEGRNLAGATKLDEYRAGLAALIKAQSSSAEKAAGRAADRETREKLQSLGYVSSPQAGGTNKTFTAQDDLKTLLPLHNKCEEAAVLYMSGRADEAIIMLEEIIATRKDFDLAYIKLASYYRDRNRLNDAVDVLRRGYESNPTSIQVATIYGVYLIDAGRNDEAIVILKKELNVIDYDPEVWNYLGVAYWKKGDADEARKAYEKALELDKNYPIAFNNLGSLSLSIFLRNRDAQSYKNALANFRRAIELDGKYATAWNGLGAALKMGGDTDGAIEAWKKAVELSPDYGFALYNLGLAYFGKGSKAEALAYFKRYKDKFYPSLSPEEQRKLDDLIQKCRL